MCDVALEVPLRSFAIVRCGQCGNTTNTRVESLSNAFDHTAFASSISTLKQDHYFLFGGYHPILQLDQLAL